MNTETASPTDGKGLVVPDFPVETPCFVILEDEVRHNMQETARIAGGLDRLVPHVKNHRSPWLTELFVRSGIRAFKAATPEEVQMILAAGAAEAIWAYPTLNRAAISHVAALAGRFPDSKIVGLVDTPAGLDAWKSVLAEKSAPNIALRVDVDPGMGRTGVPMSDAGVDLAVATKKAGLFDGWHLYDGHLHDLDMRIRTERFEKIRTRMAAIADAAATHGCTASLVAGGSYTFPLWAGNSNTRVSPGSWVLSSSQHQEELPEYHWRNAAYVLATVMSERNGTVTLDAGSKAISPDKPMDRRFAGVDKIVGISEEHSVVVAPAYRPGDQIPLVPRHACTTAYLYRTALVRRRDGRWETHAQLGCQR